MPIDLCGLLRFLFSIPTCGCHSIPCTGLTRHDLVAMAVMLGCDYMPQGVPGVGKEMAMRVVKEERDIMRILQQGETDLSGKCHLVLRLIFLRIKQCSCFGNII